MCEAISGLRKSMRLPKSTHQLDAFLRARRVLEVTPISGLKCDGYVEPLGSRFDDGFRVVVNRDKTATRIRFTLAHEVCHTFFYQFVPELKFHPHETDPAEEQLCNVGAAELLMPSAELRKIAKKSPICLATLEHLSTTYAVSWEAMLLRLRSLGLWNCELSTWHRMTNGEFAFERIVGGKQVEWKWIDSSPLELAWTGNRVTSGRGFVEYYDAQGSRRVKPISFQLSRRRNGLVALWSTKSLDAIPARIPLFELPLAAKKGTRAAKPLSKRATTRTADAKAG